MKFSIIIPVYNDYNNLKKCLNALSENKYLDESEILIIDDGSTDELSYNSKKLQSLAPNVKVILQTHKGLSAARNLGLSNASGDYVYFIDSDDIPDKDVLLTSWEICEKNNLDVLFFSFDSFADNDAIMKKYTKHIIGKKRNHKYDTSVIRGTELHSLFTQINEYYPMVWVQIAKRTFLQKHNICFDEEIIYEDNLYTFKVLKYAERSMCVNKILYHKRIRDNSITTNGETVWSVYSFLYTFIELINCIHRGLIESGPYSALRKISKMQSSYGVMLEDIRKQLIKRYLRLSSTEQLELEEKCNMLEREVLLVLTSKISVIVPMYNTEQFIKECIQSVRNQTVTNLEIIVIDDGSTDNGRAIVCEAIKTDDRVKYYYQENSGSAYARNIGLKNATGDYIAFLDSDDMYYSENALEAMIMTSIKNNVNVCGSYRVELRNNNIVPTNFLHELGDVPNEGKVFNFKDLQYDFFFQSYIYKADFIRRNNLRFPPYRRYEDPVFFLKVMDACQNFCVAPVILHCYRKGHQNYSNNGKYIYYNLLGIRDNLLMAENKYDKLFDLTIERIEKMFINDIRSNLDENVKSVLREINNTYTRKYPDNSELTCISPYL